MNFLPTPLVVRCFFVKQFQPHLPAMELQWDLDAPGVAERIWHFPNHLTICGPAPERFGVFIERNGHDQYSVRSFWNDVCMTWGKLRRREIMSSALALVLHSLGTDLWDVLEQPIANEGCTAWQVTDMRKAG